MKMLNGLCISDIHYGACDNKKLTYELEKVFFKKIRVEKENLDLVVICGDLLDHKLFFNSESSKLCIEFINKLISYSQKYSFAIRVIKGTKNHDLDQLNNFLYLQELDDVDFRIINKVSSEEFKGNSILYIPEEYMEDPKEYYKEYFDKKYDICFLHGTFNHVEFVNKLIESEKPISNAPIFSYKQFSKMINGPVLCGHIHIAQNYKKKIYYTGSFSRWKQGEEKEKGFLKFTLNDNSSDYEVKFVKNTFAPKYVTIDLEDIVDTNELEKKIKEIKKYKKENGIENLKVKINKELEEKLDSDIIKKYFSNENDNIKISVNGDIKKDIDEEDNELEEKYSFIFNNENGTDIKGISKTVSQYLSLHDNITLDSKTIEDILLSDI